MLNVRPRLGHVVVSALAAGVAGGICMDAYIWYTTILPAHGDLLQMWQYFASVAVGNVAFTSLSYAWLGLAADLVVSIAWAGGYAYLAESRSYMNDRWYISGPAYGAVVYLFMQLVLLGAGAFHWPPSYLAFVSDFVGAHMLFYGLPVALIVSKMDRAKSAAR